MTGMRLNTFSQGLAKTTRDAPYLSLQNVREEKEEHTGDTILTTPHPTHKRVKDLMPIRANERRRTSERETIPLRRKRIRKEKPQ